MSHPNGPPPLFTAHGGGGLSSGTAQAVASKGNLPSLNLDDIFGDVMFTPDGDTVFLSEQKDLMNSGEGENVATMASRASDDGKYVQTTAGGGLYTTQLHDGAKPALTMGSAGADVQGTERVPFKKNPQASHQLQYVVPKKKKERSGDRKMSEQQKVERRYVFRSFYLVLISHFVIQ